MRVLAGFLGATSGRVSIAGHDIAAAPLAAQVINAFVDKQRKKAGNIRIAEVPKADQQPKPTQESAPSQKAKAVVVSERKETQEADAVPTASAIPHTKPGTSTSPTIHEP